MKIIDRFLGKRYGGSESDARFGVSSISGVTKIEHRQFSTAKLKIAGRQLPKTLSSRYAPAPVKSCACKEPQTRACKELQNFWSGCKELEKNVSLRNYTRFV